jgi:hypothetical protein
MAPRPIAIRPLLAVLLAAPLLAGCIGGDSGEDELPQLSALRVYEYRYPGDDVAHAEHPYGWMMRVTNVAETPHWAGVRVGDPEVVEWWAVTADGPTRDDAAYRLEPGASVLFLFQAQPGFALDSVEYEVRMSEPSATAEESFDILERSVFSRDLTTVAEHRPVAPGHHVRTMTVGVWVNGTSFYTNIAALNADDAFPAGYDRSAFGGDALPIYVYDKERAEQPPGSRDTCRFVTIAGYNALLKTQAEKTTGVRFLFPEEAYTRPGAEDHSLYGDALVFMNTIVAHEGAVDDVAALPQPLGDCFDPNNTSPVPIPPVPSL